MNLRMKLALAFLLLIIVPMCALGIGMFLVTSHTIEKKYNQQAEYALQAISYNIENVFQQINNVTDNGIATSVFQMALNAKDPTKQDLGTGNQLSLNASQRNFRSLLYNYPFISYAFLYDLRSSENNQIVSIFTKENFQALPFQQFKVHPLFNEIQQLNGVPKWLAPLEYPELTGVEPVFTQIRLVKELSYFQNIGVLVVQIKKGEIDRIFRHLQISDSAQDTSFLLINEEGLIVYDPAGIYNGENMQNLGAESGRYGPGFSSVRTVFDGKESIISQYHLKNYNWSLVSVTSWEALSAETNAFAGWSVIIILSCLFAAMIFNLFFMNRITGNIAVLVRFMRRVDDGDFNARVEGKGFDEMQLLAQGFNELLDRIGGLFRRVRAEQEQKAQAELRVLQAQIKPHFLFNTLESINGLALRGEGRKVSEMVTRLGNMLRISIQDQEEIPLGEEIRHLQSYLEIQQYRFSDLFTYEIDIPPHLYSSILLKLTLQPLVENSIQHGFEGITYPGVLRISAYAERGHLVLCVEDNGIGIPQEMLARFEYMAEDPPEDMLAEGAESLSSITERRGLGLRSVADRIRIQYGAGYGIFICSAPGYGTVIRCIIPLYEQEEAG
ncbi:MULTISPECIES: sensor histidine kinase [unclassified Paenibacillus]|uniref:cache domain-containing sensor histidine kinase n=1 Tax=unclassified Paenibacillus TaxID=185978 RepID=UPI000CFCDDA5|nr:MULTISPECIES: sensor histidine kinase [unclassified Paenibacillus]MBD8839615.1 sensor histidine kinase [Paenibacillus sp. CFBP 13594]PRA05293.1 two-component sensor histidine kinase [Paenibacillus sp. MYb63]PRA50361.1 two-component sensor histidine kinase [Paenibacillus sp. MYb67]QZN75174.1 sensor histidine kinase [Paenibacillus sp. DR312]